MRITYIYYKWGKDGIIFFVVSPVMVSSGSHLTFLFVKSRGLIVLYFGGQYGMPLKFWCIMNAS
jgi:phosphate starvation-inducible membrane PsiE